ncbi:MAG: chaperone modulator CbpM [Deltaproteobacteria bacterium]|nr:chaperone modulator CbpM [Deltaproteobacteria bacterium]
MTVRWLRLQQVCTELRVDADLLRTVRDEGLVTIKESSEAEPVISADDAERLRLIRLLMQELEVNLAGVEVILHMHDDLRSMREQFDVILRSLVDEMRQRMGNR